MESNATHSSRISDFGVLEQYLGYQTGNASSFNRSSLDPGISGQNIDPKLQSRALNNSLDLASTNFSTRFRGSLPVQLHKGPQPNIASSSAARHDDWGDPNMAESSSHTETSTGVEPDDRLHQFEMGQSAAVAVSDGSDRSKEHASDQKALRRLAQNREAARKSRLRKKAYVQQLETSRVKLSQLEQELQRARQQGVFMANMVDQAHSGSENGALAFDVEYGRWMEEHSRKINELRTAINVHDMEIRTIVDSVTTHFYEIFKIKGIAAKADVFHILSGMWKTPAERCFLWIGGFRPSEILKLISNQLDTLTDQQLSKIYNLQQSSNQAEDALSQGMEALRQSLAETLANNSISGAEVPSGNVANYMGQMAMAMGKLGAIEGFLRQADNLRQQTLQQMLDMLTTKQSAHAHLFINDYFSRLRALSSLWLARPQE